MATGSVKSAGRAVQILGLFAEARRPMRANEIAKALKLPASSTAGLLGTLVGLEFLTFDGDYNYFPTERVARLGNWLRTTTTLEENARVWARRVYSATGSSVGLSRRSGIYIDWLFALGGRAANGEGRWPVCRTMTGLTALSRESDAEVEAVISKHNDLLGRQDQLYPREILRKVDELRRRPYGVGIGAVIPNLANLCFVLEDGNSADRILMNVVVPAHELTRKEREIIDSVQNTIPTSNILSQVAGLRG
jgi:DNA-binding IclR family transcriptional regulator